jgi:hypothetical protein
MALPAHSGPRPLIQFRNHFSQTVRILGRVISPSQGRHLHTGQHKHRITHTKLPYLEWDSNPRSQLHVLDRAATVTRLNNNNNNNTAKYMSKITTYEPKTAVKPSSQAFCSPSAHARNLSYLSYSFGATKGTETHPLIQKKIYFLKLYFFIEIYVYIL